MASIAAAAAALVLVAGCSSAGEVATDEGLAGAAGGSGGAEDHGSVDLSGSAPTVEMELDDTYFAPTTVRAEPGAVVTVELTNEGTRVHTFTIDGTDVDATVDPGSTGRVEVTVPSSGDVPYYCRFHSEAGMRGSFAVTGGAGSPAPSTTGSTPTTAGGRDGY